MLQEIIERLRKLPKRKDDGEYNGCYEVLRYDIEHYRRDKNNYDYYDIYGFIWGLYATEFITESERQEALNELRAI